VGLPAGGRHDVGERGAFGTAQEFEDDGLLAALARAFGLSGIRGRLGLRRRNRGRLGRRDGRQVTRPSSLVSVSFRWIDFASSHSEHSI
jgi:hypothetical protein